MKNVYFSFPFSQYQRVDKTTEWACYQCLKIQVQFHFQWYFWVVLARQQHLFCM